MTPCLASRVPSSLWDADSSASHPVHFPGEGHHQTQAVMFLPGQDPVSPLKWSLQSHIPLGFGCTTLPCGVGLIRQRILLDFWVVSYCECSTQQQMFLNLNSYLYFPMSVCTCTCAPKCATVHVGDRGQLPGASSSFLPPSLSLEWNSGYQGWQQTPSQNRTISPALTCDVLQMDMTPMDNTQEGWGHLTSWAWVTPQGFGDGPSATYKKHQEPPGSLGQDFPPAPVGSCWGYWPW